MGQSERAIEAARQKLANQLLRKRMQQAAQAQANLERALEMSRSHDISELELSDSELEVDDADLFDLDLDAALDEDDEELDDEATTDDLELLESQVASLRDTLHRSSRVAQLSPAEEEELLAAMRAGEPAMLGERGSAAGSTQDALAALAAGLRERAAQSGQAELAAATRLLEGLAGRLGEPAPTSDDPQEVLRAYLDLARVLAASGAALALVVERHLRG